MRCYLLPSLFLATLLTLVTSFTAYATKPIANWDVVPHQRISKPFKAGVVAFHETGVELHFQVNGEDAGMVTAPTWNDRTKVFEYWIDIDPAKYADGPITLKVTAHPKGAGHEPRVLEDLTLYANSGGALTTSADVWVDSTNGNDATGEGSERAPFASIEKAVSKVNDGGTIYLNAGKDYTLSSFGKSEHAYWTTISAAPGLTADDVHIAGYHKNGLSTGRYGKSGVRWRNVSIYCDRKPGWGTILYLERGSHTWLDGCTLYDKNGRWSSTALFTGASPYLTDCHIRDVTNCGGCFHRNVHIENVGADVYRGSTNLTAINVTIQTMDRGATDAHPDLIQFYNPEAPVENVVLYNVRAYDMMAQGLFGAKGGVADVAFVNLLLEKSPPESALMSQITGTWDHALFWHITIVDQSLAFREIKGLSNFDVRNCVFASFRAQDNRLPEGNRVESVHTGTLAWNQPAPLGARATTGDPLFVDSDRNDYRLQAESPAYRTGARAPGVPADIDGVLYNETSPNRGAFSSANRK